MSRGGLWLAGCIANRWNRKDWTGAASRPATQHCGAAGSAAQQDVQPRPHPCPLLLHSSMLFPIHTTLLLTMQRSTPRSSASTVAWLESSSAPVSESGSTSSSRGPSAAACWRPPAAAGSGPGSAAPLLARVDAGRCRRAPALLLTAAKATGRRRRQRRAATAAAALGVAHCATAAIAGISAAVSG